MIGVGREKEKEKKIYIQRKNSKIANLVVRTLPAYKRNNTNMTVNGVRERVDATRNGTVYTVSKNTILFQRDVSTFFSSPLYLLD